jgi:Domain of Unknown Function (DUF930)
MTYIHLDLRVGRPNQSTDEAKLEQLEPMRAIGHSNERSVAWGIAASVILHVIVGVALTLVPDPTRSTHVPEAGVSVEIMTLPPPVPAVRGAPEPPASASAPETTRAPALSDQDAALPSPGRSAPRAGPHGMLKATQMLSEQWLADTRSQQAVKMLPLLAADERMEQLCAIEAMAQINAWKRTFQPDHLVAYAMAETKVSGNALRADGAAFHSNRHWYKIRFKCDLTADHTKVVSFEFVVGDVVPRSEWERYSLPDEGGSLD